MLSAQWLIETMTRHGLFGQLVTVRKMNSDLKSLSERFGQLAKLAGNASELARICDYPQRTMAGWAKGEREPKISDAAQIADRMGVNLDWLATGRGPMRGTTDSQTTSDPVKLSNNSNELLQNLLEVVIEGMEIALGRLSVNLTQKDKAKIVGTLYGISYRRYLVRTSGGTPLDVTEEFNPDSMASDVADLVRLVANSTSTTG